MAKAFSNRIAFRLGFTLLCVLLTQKHAAAQDVTRLYSREVLRQSGATYARNIQGMWEEDFVARLEPQERQRAGRVTLFLPMVGALKHPLEYYSQPRTRRVFIPIASVKFLDDLSIALAYYERQGCDLSAVFDYVALLKARPEDFTEPPLAALGVPDDALEDFYVDDVSQKLLKSSLFFLAAHEYAHVLYAHSSYAEITPEAGQAQEIEADAFALDVLRRIAVAPLAMSQFFMVTTRLEATPQDFASDADYRTHLGRSTHPVSALRLEKVASNIEENLDAYANAQQRPTDFRRSLGKIVVDLRQMAESLADDSMRSFMAFNAQDLDAAQLATSCRPDDP